jgi:hypothetical protein
MLFFRAHLSLYKLGAKAVSNGEMSHCNERLSEITEAEFLDEISKSLKDFSSLLFTVPSTQQSTAALRFIFLQTHATSYSFYSSVTR